MKRIYIPFLILSLLYLLNFTGCLAVETKEYSFRLTKGNSGEATIKFINIMRTKDSASTIEDAYNELVESYLKGTKPEDEMTGVRNVKKRLYEQDNQLCGEITFTFEDIRDLKFFNYKGLVWAYFVGFTGMIGNESYFSSNGTYGEADMPVIFWDASQKEFNFKTTLTTPGENTESLLPVWKSRGGN
ncbi:MAG: hypothetical protein N2510_08130 [Ignavibacteria bacterium]|nr:hypothetical protein [Ignavibacteria bacterium]